MNRHLHRHQPLHGPATFFGRRLAGLALCLAALAVALPARAVEGGQVAPEFELPGRAGTLKLSDYKGKLVYLDFWASWCGPCKQSFPWMNDMQARYGDKGLRIVGVNVDKKQDDAN